MAAGYLIIGMFAGMLTFVVSLIAGVSFWYALVLYSAVGTCAILGAATLHFVIASFRGNSSMSADEEEEEEIGLQQSVLDPAPTHGDLPSPSPDAEMRILAVDDDPSLLELIPMIAAQADFSDVTTVSSGELALEAIAKTDTVFDCFLLDISMPEMDGIELCSRIRKIDGYAHTPIIMLTAMRDMDSLGRAFKAGASEYATKPFDIAELGDRLREAQDTVTARKESVAKSMACDDLSRDATVRDTLDLSDDTSFSDLPGFVDYDALGHYLTRLSRGDLKRTSVFCLKIDQIEMVQSLASAEVLSQVLKKTAGTIGDIYGDSEALAAYVGHGAFMIVSDAGTGGVSHILHILEDDIETKLKRFDFQDSNGEPLEIGVSIGEPISPDAGDKATRARLTFSRAIASSDLREWNKGGESIPSTIRSV